MGGAAAELCLHPGGRGGAVLHGEAADRAVLARVDGGGLLARLAPQHETLLLLALVPILAAHRTDPNAYLYEDAAPRKAALADTERLPAVVLNKAGYEVAPDLFLEEFAKREAVDQASGEDDAASLRAAVESRDLHDGFLLYGYNYDAAVLRALAEDTLDVEKIEFVTDGERCPVYYIELK